MWKKNMRKKAKNNKRSVPLSIFSFIENYVTIVFLLLSSLKSFASRIMRISL